MSANTFTLSLRIILSVYAQHTVCQPNQLDQDQCRSNYPPILYKKRADKYRLASGSDWFAWINENRCAPTLRWISASKQWSRSTLDLTTLFSVFLVRSNHCDFCIILIVYKSGQSLFSSCKLNCIRTDWDTLHASVWPHYLKIHSDILFNIHIPVFIANVFERYISLKNSYFFRNIKNCGKWIY